MATTAAYPRKIQIAPDSSGSAGAYADLEYQNKIDLEEPSDNDDVSQTNSAGFHLRIPTLLDSKLSLEFLFDSTATAQNSIRAARTGRVQCWVKIFLTASTGIIYPMVVDSLKTTFDPSKVVRQNVSLSGNGAVATF